MGLRPKRSRLIAPSSRSTTQWRPSTNPGRAVEWMPDMAPRLDARAQKRRGGRARPGAARASPFFGAVTQAPGRPWRARSRRWAPRREPRCSRKAAPSQAADLARDDFFFFSRWYMARNGEFTSGPPAGPQGRDDGVVSADTIPPTPGCRARGSPRRWPGLARAARAAIISTAGLAAIPGGIHRGAGPRSLGAPPKATRLCRAPAAFGQCPVAHRRGGRETQIPRLPSPWAGMHPRRRRRSIPAEVAAALARLTLSS